MFSVRPSASALRGPPPDPSGEPGARPEGTSVPKDIKVFLLLFLQKKKNLVVLKEEAKNSYL
jgi:hypothetical protein